jgi:hypothetical protein
MPDVLLKDSLSEATIPKGKGAGGRPNAATAILTFYIIGQEGHLGHVATKLAANLLVGSLLQLGAGIDGIIVCREERLDVSGCLTILDVGEELELGLDTTRREDGECFSGLLPCL